MEKKFKKIDDYLEVTVTVDDKILLPTEKGKLDVGTFSQVTTQKILDIETFIGFVKIEKDKAETQLKALESQLEGVKDVNVDIIDEKILNECSRILGKSTKEFKQKMLVLNNNISQIQQKKQLIAQIEYIKTQLEPMSKDLADINEAIK